MIWAATILENEAGPLLKACVEQLLPFVDKWVFVDGGSNDDTLRLLDSFRSDKIQVLHRRYEHELRGSDGRQRNSYLKIIPDGDWILVIDADEVISDEGYLLREIAKGDKGVFDIRMKHYFYHFGLEDATVEKHYVPRRLFKKEAGMYYDEVEHPILKGFTGDNGSGVSQVDSFVLHHFSNCRGVEHFYDKAQVQYSKSNIHTKEQMDAWLGMRLTGTYPIKAAKVEELPRTIRKWLP